MLEGNGFYNNEEKFMKENFLGMYIEGKKLATKLQSKKERIKDLKERLDYKTEELRLQNTQNERLEEEISQLKTEIVFSNQEIENLNDEVEELKKGEVIKDRILKKNEAQRKIIGQKDNIIRKEEEKRKNLDIEIGDLNYKITKLKDSSKTSKKNLEKAKKKINELNEEKNLQKLEKEKMTFELHKGMLDAKKNTQMIKKCLLETKRELKDNVREMNEEIEEHMSSEFLSDFFVDRKVFKEIPIEEEKRDLKSEMEFSIPPYFYPQKDNQKSIVIKFPLELFTVENSVLYSLDICSFINLILSLPVLLLLVFFFPPLSVFFVNYISCHFRTDGCSIKKNVSRFLTTKKIKYSFFLFIAFYFPGVIYAFCYLIFMILLSFYHSQNSKDYDRNEEREILISKNEQTPVRISEV